VREPQNQDRGEEECQDGTTGDAGTALRLT